MIVGSLFFLMGSVLALLAHILAAITYIIPDQIQTAIEWAFSQLSYLDFFFPMSDIMLAIGTVITFIALWYEIKIIFWTFTFIPFVGGKLEKTPKIN